MNENAREQKNLLQEHLTKVSSKILSSSFRFNLTPDASEDPFLTFYIGLCYNEKGLFLSCL